MPAARLWSVVLVLIVTAVATAVRIFTFWAFELESATPGARVAIFAAVVAAVSAAALIPLGFIIDRAIRRMERSIQNDPHANLSSNRSMPFVLRPLARVLNAALTQLQGREQTLRAQISDLEIRHRVSEAERRQAEAVLHALRDPVIVTDAFDEVIMVNPAAAKVLRFADASGQSALHRSIDQVIEQESIRRLIRDARHSADFTNARHVEVEISPGCSQSQGSAVPGAGSADSDTRVAKSNSCLFEITLTAVANHKREVGAVVTILHDLTRERELSKMKSDFVSKASHELRTPLASIRAYVEMLVDGEAGDASGATAQEFYRVIAGETDRLGRLIDNMLNISRIEAGIVDVQRENVDVKALIERAVHTLEPQAKEKGISVTTKFFGGLGQGSGVRDKRSAGQLVPHSQAQSPGQLCVEGDADMLYQVVLNLMSNAIKYMPATVGGSAGNGRLTLADAAASNGQNQSIATDAPARITLTADSDNLTRSVIVSVADTGLGIPPEELGKLFEKFHRVENYKRMAKGTGLGLALCKHIVETVHHGQMGVESKLGMGSKFWFSIPMKYAGKKAA